MESCSIWMWRAISSPSVDSICLSSMYCTHLYYYFFYCQMSEASSKTRGGRFRICGHCGSKATSCQPSKQKHSLDKLYWNCPCQGIGGFVAWVKAGELNSLAASYLSNGNEASSGCDHTNISEIIQKCTTTSEALILELKKSRQGGLNCSSIIGALFLLLVGLILYYSYSEENRNIQV